MKLRHSGPPSQVLSSQLGGDLSTTDSGRNQAGNKKSNNSALDEREAPIPFEEERQRGRVEFDIVSTYWKAVGMYVSPAVLVMLSLMQSTRNVSDWWLAHWLSDIKQNSTNNSVGGVHQQYDDSNYDPTFYLAVYGGIAAANTIFTFVRAFLFAYGGLQAAKYLHNRLVNVILQVICFIVD